MARYLILLKPKWLAVANYFKRKERSDRDVIRDLVVLFLALSVAFFIFRGTSWFLKRLGSDATFISLPPSLPLSMIFGALLIMLLLSNLVSAVGSLYFSNDLDLTLAAPLTPWRFYFEKIVYVVVNSSWTSIVFIFPMILAFGVHYQAGYLYYLGTILLIVPYFLLPTSLSFLIGTLFVRFIPVKRLKLLVYLFALLLLVGIGLAIDILYHSLSMTGEKNQLDRLIAILSLSNQPFLPSAWLGQSLEGLLFNKPHSALNPAMQLVFVTIGLLALGYLTLQLFHFSAFSRSKYVATAKDRVSKISLFFTGIIDKFSNTQAEAALARKDLFLFVREVTSILQVLLLSGICLLYLVNLKIFGDADNLNGQIRFWWQSFFFVSNWCVGTFVATAIATRLVFPSISLEGKSIWIIQTSPLSKERFMQTKFNMWFAVIMMVASVVLAAGAYLTDCPASVVVFAALAGGIIAYGIVGLAVGLGAYFSNFDWELPSDLAASFGSLVFMLVSVLASLFNLVLAWFVLYTAPIIGANWQIALVHFVTITAVISLMFVFNISLAKGALKLGRDKLS